MQRPPDGVKMVIEAVCIMKGMKPKKVAGDKVINACLGNGSWFNIWFLALLAKGLCCVKVYMSNSW